MFQLPSWTTLGYLTAAVVFVVLYKFYTSRKTKKKAVKVILSQIELDNERNNKATTIQINPVARKVTVGNDFEAVKARQPSLKTEKTEFDPWIKLMVIETIYKEGGMIYSADKRTRIKIKANTPLPREYVEFRRKLEEEAKKKIQ